METVVLNGHAIEVQEIHPDLDGVVKFKNQRGWSRIEDAFIPNVSAFNFIKRLGVGFWDQSEKKPASNSCLRRYIEQGNFRFNGKILKPDTMLNFPLLSVIMFPKSERHYKTIW